jgi:hypothetical protein
LETSVLSLPGIVFGIELLLPLSVVSGEKVNDPPRGFVADIAGDRKVSERKFMGAFNWVNIEALVHLVYSRPEFLHGGALEVCIFSRPDGCIGPTLFNARRVFLSERCSRSKK